MNSAFQATVILVFALCLVVAGFFWIRDGLRAGKLRRRRKLYAAYRSTAPHPSCRRMGDTWRDYAFDKSGRRS